MSAPADLARAAVPAPRVVAEQAGAPTSGVGTDPHAEMLPELYRVRRRKRETHDTVTVGLAPARGGPVRFSPGQFNMVYLFGRGEAAISISGDPADDGLLWHTVRDVGGVTGALCRSRRGEHVGVRGPYGTDWRVTDAAGGDVVMVTGGIGLAPLRPALLQVLHERDRYRRVVLLYGARSPQDILYAGELAALRGLDVEVTVDHAGEGWKGNVGVVTNLIPKAPFDPKRTLALLCGPEIMMRFTAAALRDRGVPASRIRVSMERNMKCGIGLCGHCQLGPVFVCKHGPVFPLQRVARLMRIREV